MGPLKAKATVSTDKDLEEEKNKSQVKKEEEIKSEFAKKTPNKIKNS